MNKIKMLEDVCEYYDNVEELFDKFYKSLGTYKLDEKKDVPEVYLITSLQLSHHYVKSITTLLREELPISVVIISRSIIELAFSLRWIFEPGEREKVTERVLKLEADPFHHIDKEIKRMEDAIKEGKSDWKFESIESFRKQMNAFKDTFDQLLEIDKEGNNKFKKGVSVADMMGDLRNRFYHLYVYTSGFIHPNPFLRYFLANKTEKYEEFIKGLRMNHSYCLYFLYVIMHSGMNYLDQINTEAQDIRKEYCDQLLELVNKSNKNYFRINKQSE